MRLCCQVGRTPGLVDLESQHSIGNTVTTISDCANRTTGSRNRINTIAVRVGRIFQSAGQGDAVAERSGVSNGCDFVTCVDTDWANEIVRTELRASEGAQTANGQATQLDVSGGVDLELLCGAVSISALCCIAFALLRSGLLEAIALVEAGVNNGTEQAVFGVGAGIQGDAHLGTVAEGVLGLGKGLCPHAFNVNVTTHLQAGVGAGDVVEAWAESRADFDVLSKS